MIQTPMGFQHQGGRGDSKNHEEEIKNIVQDINRNKKQTILSHRKIKRPNNKQITPRDVNLPQFISPRDNQ